MIDRHGPRQRDHCTFRYRVRGQTARPQGGNRGNIDDGAAACRLFHCRDRIARGHKHAVDIDLHDPAPLLRRHLSHPARTTDPDIVVEAVEPAEPRERLGHHRVCLPLVSDIGDEGGGGPTFRLDHRHGAFGALAVEIDDKDFGPGACKQDRCSPPVADAVIRRSAAGDDRHLAGKAEIVVLA